MSNKIEIGPEELANFTRRSLLGTSMGLGAIAAAELLGGRSGRTACRARSGP